MPLLPELLAPLVPQSSVEAHSLFHLRRASCVAVVADAATLTFTCGVEPWNGYPRTGLSC